MREGAFSPGDSKKPQNGDASVGQDPVSQPVLVSPSGSMLPRGHSQPHPVLNAEHRAERGPPGGLGS